MFLTYSCQPGSPKCPYIHSGLDIGLLDNGMLLGCGCTLLISIHPEDGDTTTDLEACQIYLKAAYQENTWATTEALRGMCKSKGY